MKKILSVMVLAAMVLCAQDSGAERPGIGKKIVQGTGKVVESVVDTTGDVVSGAADLTKDGAEYVVDGVTADPVDKKAKSALNKGVNCSTARNDIAVLEGEKATTAAQLKNGVKSVLPVTAAARILSGTYREGVGVAAGQYNSDIDAKIAQIKKTCRI